MEDAASFDTLEGFLTELRLCLGSHRASLVEMDSALPVTIEHRVFEVPEAPLPALLLVYRTQLSPHLLSNECRVRIVVTLPQDQLATIARRRRDANRLSMLGAVDADGRTVWSQTSIDPFNGPILAPIVATALLYSGSSLLAGLHRTGRPSFRDMLRGKFRRPSPPKTPSVWSDADMELIHFDHAHLGGVLEAGIWRLTAAEAKLSLTPIDGDPFFGGGLLLHLEMPRETFAIGERKVSAGELNTLAHYLGEVPSFGSWSEEAEGYSFRSFIPNFIGPTPYLAEYFVGWAVLRSHLARSLAEQYPRLADFNQLQRQRDWVKR